MTLVGEFVLLNSHQFYDDILNEPFYVWVKLNDGMRSRLVHL